MEDAGDDTETSLLLTHDKEQRLGILRIFHHKLYCKDKSQLRPKPCYKTLYYNYCQRNKSVSWGLSIGVCFLITGVLCVTYGFMIPGIYRTLGTEQHSSHLLQNNLSNHRSSIPTITKRPSNKDEKNMTLYRDVFVIMGLAIFALGGILLSVFLLWPVYENDDADKSPTHSPIFVEYELPTIGSDDEMFNNGKELQNESQDSTQLPIAMKQMKQQPDEEEMKSITSYSDK